MGRIGTVATPTRGYSEKKVKYHNTMNRLLDDYDKIIVVGVDNVQSMQLQNIRQELRGSAEMLLGKNTMMKKVLSLRRDREGATERDRLLWERFVQEGLLRLNVGLVFTNRDPLDAKKVIDSHLIQAPARQGAVAPVDVTVPAGNTGLEPTKTSFFQALNIPTKITKGTVEILKDQLVVREGERVGSSEATLLKMLKVNPFHYGLEVQTIWDCGEIYGAYRLTLDHDALEERFRRAIATLASFSVGTGIETAVGNSLLHASAGQAADDSAVPLEMEAPGDESEEEEGDGMFDLFG